MYLVLVLHLCGVNSDTVDPFADRLQKGTTGFASVLPSGRMKWLDSRGTDFLNTVSYGRPAVKTTVCVLTARLPCM